MPSPASTAMWSALLADMEFSLWEPREIIVVIASEAKQSILPQNGLLRRFAPRNDGKKRILRREHRAPHQPALFQIYHRLIGFGPRPPCHPNWPRLLCAHPVR